MAAWICLPAAANTTPAPRAAAFISYGAKLTGAISPPGTVNTYSFEGVAGETVSLLLAKTSGSGFPRAELYGPDGTSLGGQTMTSSVKLDAALRRSGTHTIRVVDGFNGAFTYNYTLTLVRVAPPDPLAIPLAFGQSTTGSINATMDAYGFYAAAGNTVSVTIAKTSGSGFARGEVYGPDGARIAGQTMTTTVTFNLTLSRTGNHTILVLDGFNGAFSYSYRVDLQCLGSCASPPLPAALRFVPVQPCRVSDTRYPAGALGGPVMAANSTRTIPVPQSGCGIPASARAYSLNVTVVPRSALGFLTLWPSGQPRPWVSTLNSPAGKVVANAAVVPAGTGGSVDVYVTDSTDVVLDINGYFAPPDTPGSLMFYPVAPCRVSDTRNPPGIFGGPTPGPGASINIPVTASSCNIPASAQAYSLNVTVVPQRPLSYLTLWQTGQPLPLASTLNSPDGSIVANAAIVPAGTAGSVSVFVTDPTDVVLDINGYFAPPSSAGLGFYATTPCRISDSRNPVDVFGGPVLSAGSTRTYPINLSACSIPAVARAYSLNATVVPSGPLWYLTLWPFGEAQPFVSTLNSTLGLIVANAAIVPAGASGSISAYVTGQTHLILDINGYFAP